MAWLGMVEGNMFLLKSNVVIEKCSSYNYQHYLRKQGLYKTREFLLNINDINIYCKQALIIQKTFMVILGYVYE